MNPLPTCCALLVAAAFPLKAQIYADFTVSQGDEPLGTFRAELAWEKAPRPVAHFIGLATGRHSWIDNDTGLVHDDTPFFDGSHFQRLIHRFVIQGGDPPGKEGRRGGYVVQDQFHEDLRHDGRFILSWAKSSQPNTTSGQFFITLGRSGDPVEAAALKSLDDKHSVFGEVTEGKDIIRDFASPTKFPTNADDLPLTRITLDSVVISGPSLDSFDIDDPALRLPVVKRHQFIPTRGPEENQFTMTWDRSVQSDYVIALGTSLDNSFRFRNFFAIDAPDEVEFTVDGVTFPSFFGFLAEVDYSLLPNAPTELTAAGNTLIITHRSGDTVTLVFDGADGGTWSDSRGRSGTLSGVVWTDSLPAEGIVVRDPASILPWLRRSAAIELPLGRLRANFDRPAGRDNWLQLADVYLSFHEEANGFVEGGASDKDGIGVAVNQAFQFVPAGG